MCLFLLILTFQKMSGDMRLHRHQLSLLTQQPVMRAENMHIYFAFAFARGGAIAFPSDTINNVG